MRKQKMKKILSLLAAGVLLLMSMSGCGKEAETGKTQVAMIVKSTESAFFKSVFAGARAAATEYNLNVTFNGPESEEDYVTQNEMVRQAMEDGVDVIVFSAVDYNANAEIIGQAAQRGIKIVVIDSDVNSSMVSCRIGTNNLQAGVKAAEAALAVGEDELYIGIVNYDVNSANGQQRELGFRQTVEQDPRVKDITTINVLSTTEDARAGAKEMLLSDSRINVVVTFNEWTSLGVGWAIRDLDRGDRTQVVAFDSNVVSVGMLETGEVDALIVQNPYAMGYLGVETAANLINGQTGGPSVIDTATTIVTRENMYERESQKTSPYNFAYFVLNDDREKLYRRIDARVDAMVKAGLVDEVARLQQMGCHADMVSMQGLGYKEILAYLNGTSTLEEAIYIIKRESRHFAKRQLTWFRRERDVTWLNKPDFEYDDTKILTYMMDVLQAKGILPA